MIKGLTIGPAEPTEWYHPSLSSSLDRVRLRNVAIRNSGHVSTPFFFVVRRKKVYQQKLIYMGHGPPKPTFLNGFYGKHGPWAPQTFIFRGFLW